MTIEEFLTDLETWTRENNAHWFIKEISGKDKIRCNINDALCCPITAKAGKNHVEFETVAREMGLKESDALRVAEAADDFDHIGTLRNQLIKACRLPHQYLTN